MTGDPSAVDRELARLRAKAGEQVVEIARLRDEAAEASGELAQLEAEAGELHRRELDLSEVVERLRREARVHDDVITRLLERLAADELELNDLRAIRDALTPPELASRPGVDLAASFLPATDGVSGDFYLLAEGPHEATVLVVGDVVGKAGQTPPFSNAPRKTATSSPSDVSPSREGTAASAGDTQGHPPVLWLDTGEELSGGRAPPLGLSEELACTPAAHHLTPGIGVLLYTDGVTEARHNGEQFGQTRLAQIVQALGAQSPSEVVAAVTTEVQQSAATGLVDDLCVVAARTAEG